MMHPCQDKSGSRIECRREKVTSSESELWYIESYLGSGRIRTVLLSTTVNLHSQSFGESKMAAAFSAVMVGEGMEIRNRIMPREAFAPRRKTSSPNSLSKVNSSRESARALASAPSSDSPGALSRIHKTSCPRCRNKATQSPGTFSLAQRRTDHPSQAMSSMKTLVLQSIGLSRKPGRRGYAHA